MAKCDPRWHFKCASTLKSAQFEFDPKTVSMQMVNEFSSIRICWVFKIQIKIRTASVWRRRRQRLWSLMVKWQQQPHRIEKRMHACVAPVSPDACVTYLFVCVAHNQTKNRVSFIFFPSYSFFLCCVRCFVFVITPVSGCSLTQLNSWPSVAAAILCFTFFFSSSCVSFSIFYWSYIPSDSPPMCTCV